MGIIVDNNMLCHQNLREEDKLKSSTRSEVYPVLYGLQIFEQVFKGKRILWRTDNAATPIVMKRVSRRSDLQALAILYIPFNQFCLHSSRSEMGTKGGEC